VKISEPAVSHKRALQALRDNISCLEHPRGSVKLPYFQTHVGRFQLARNPDAVNEVARIFCEAVIMLLEKHGLLADENADA
jgi:hypothetical protein